MDFLHPGYIEFMGLLEAHKVRYFLLGGIAVNIHGYARTTEDLDILFEASQENGMKLLKCVELFGFDTSGFANYDFSQPTHFRVGDFPNSIDLINHTVGIDFDKAFDHSIAVEIEQLSVKVIHINDLIANKMALNTYKDLADAEALKRIHFDK
jgi:hypothetical protein